MKILRRDPSVALASSEAYCLPTTPVHISAPAPEMTSPALPWTASPRPVGLTAATSRQAPQALHAGAAAAAGFDFDAAAASIRASLGAYVGADTTNPPGNESRVVDMIAERLMKAGITPDVSEFAPGRKNLVATLKGSGDEKPLILMAHTDVVGTAGQPWSTPPHVLTDIDGLLYGRGTRDDLIMVAANVELFLMLAAAKVPLKRDIILVCTGDEETASAGMRDLLQRTPSLAQAGLVINEGGAIVNGKVGGPATWVGYEVAQKTTQDFILETTGIAGHSGIPLKGNNAIARIGRAVARIGETQRAPRLNEVSRAFFRERAKLEQPRLRDAMNAIVNATGELPADAVAIVDENPAYAAMMRTTFAPTLINGGIKNNVLPPSAMADVNARILPDESIDDAEKWLKDIIGDDKVTIKRGQPIGSGPAAALEGEFVTALRSASATLWPDAPVIPMLGIGYTDSRFFRQMGVAAYGFNPFPGGDAELQRIHGANELIQGAVLRPGIELYTKLVMELAAKPLA